jgi:hypothetical protein
MRSCLLSTLSDGGAKIGAFLKGRMEVAIVVRGRWITRRSERGRRKRKKIRRTPLGY